MIRWLLVACCVFAASVALAQTVGRDGIFNGESVGFDGIINGKTMIGPPPANPCSAVLGGPEFNDANGCNLIWAMDMGII